MEPEIKDGNPIRIPYSKRWGRPRTRVLKGHPKREARRQRAAARAMIPTPIERTKKYRLLHA